MKLIAIAVAAMCAALVSADADFSDDAAAERQEHGRLRFAGSQSGQKAEADSSSMSVSYAGATDDPNGGYDKKDLAKWMTKDLDNILNGINNIKKARGDEKVKFATNRAQRTSALDAKASKYMSQRDTAKKSIADLEADLAKDLSDYKKKLAEKVTAIRQKGVEWEAKTKAAESKRGTLNAQAKEAVDKVERAHNAWKAAEEASEAAELLAHTKHIEQLHKEQSAAGDTAQKQLDSLTTAYGEISKQIADAQAKAKFAKGELKRVTDALAAEKKTLEEGAAGLKKQIDEVAAAAKKEEADMKKAADEEKGRVAGAQKDAEAKIAEERGKTEKRIADLKAKYGKMEEKLKADAAAAEDKIKDYKAQAKLSKDRAKAQSERLTKLKAALVKLQKKMDEAQAAYDARMRDLAIELKKAEAALGPMKDTITKAEETKKKAENDLKAATELAAKAKKEGEEAAAKLAGQKEAAHKAAEVAKKAMLQAQLSSEQDERKAAAAAKRAAKQVAAAAKQRDEAARAAAESASEAERAKAAAADAAKQNAKVAAQLAKDMEEARREKERKAKAEAKQAEARKKEADKMAKTTGASADNIKVQIAAIEQDTGEMVNKTAYQRLLMGQAKVEILKLEDETRHAQEEAARKMRKLKEEMAALLDAEKAAHAEEARMGGGTGGAAGAAGAAANASNALAAEADKDATAAASLSSSMADALKKTADLQALMASAVANAAKQADSTAGASTGASSDGAALGVMYAMEDLAQQLESDVKKVTMDKEALAAALEDAKRAQAKEEARQASVNNDISDMKRRVGQSADEAAAQSPENVARYKSLLAQKAKMLEQVESAEEELDGVREGGAPGPATLARIAKRQADKEAAIAAAKKAAAAEASKAAAAAAKKGGKGPAGAAGNGTAKAGNSTATAAGAAAGKNGTAPAAGGAKLPQAANATGSATNSSGSALKSLHASHADNGALPVGTRVRVSAVNGRILPDNYSGSEPSFWGRISRVVQVDAPTVASITGTGKGAAAPAPKQQNVAQAVASAASALAKGAVVADLLAEARDDMITAAQYNGYPIPVPGNTHHAAAAGAATGVYYRLPATGGDAANAAHVVLRAPGGSSDVSVTNAQAHLAGARFAGDDNAQAGSASASAGAEFSLDMASVAAANLGLDAASGQSSGSHLHEALATANYEDAASMHAGAQPEAASVLLEARVGSRAQRKAGGGAALTPQ